jgi:DNA-binding XRE family transcriptional regulator
MKIIVKRGKLLQLMAKNFLTQKDLAEKLEITPQAVNAIIKERNGTGIDTAKKICDLFKCVFEDIFELPAQGE